MSMRLLFALVIVLIVMFSNLVVGDVGTAASYGPPYIPTACDGNKREQFPPGNMFAAVSEGLWDNGAACGRRYRVRCVSGKNRPCKGGTIDVRVVDSCSSSSSRSSSSTCSSTLLLSNDAFASISRFPHAKINVEYIQV